MTVPYACFATRIKMRRVTNGFKSYTKQLRERAGSLPQWVAGFFSLSAVTAAEIVDQPLGRGVLGRGFFAADQAVVDTFAQLFAQLHAPLVEGVDAPDHALHENLVFVHRHQCAEATRA